MPPAAERSFWWVFGLLALLVTGAVALPSSLPMTDWPQHAQQVAALHDLALDRCEYATIYRVHWLTPYWLGYLPASLLAFVLPVEAAMRLVLLAGLLGLPLATRFLIREAGGEGWWSLAAFGASFGANFDWGFFNFLVAAPLVPFVAALTLRQVRTPSPRRALALSLAGLLAFAGHAAVGAGALLMASAMAVAEVGRTRAGVAEKRLAPLTVVKRLAPLAGVAGVAGIWVAGMAAFEPAARESLRGGAPALVRLLELPRLLTGLVAWPLALAAVGLLIAALGLGGFRPARQARCWLPLGGALALFALVPNYLLGVAQVYPRLLPFLLPCALLAAEVAPRRPATAPWRRWALPAVVAAILLASAGRFAGFARESSGLHEVLAAAPARERLLYLPLERESPHSLAPVYLHAGASYPVGRCGVAAVSFATGSSYAPAVRFRPEAEPRLPAGFEWHAERLRWEGVRGQFGLFLVRSTTPVAAAQLFGGEGRVELLARQGGWWLYRSLAASGPPAMEPRPAG